MLALRRTVTFTEFYFYKDIDAQLEVINEEDEEEEEENRQNVVNVADIPYVFFTKKHQSYEEGVPFYFSLYRRIHVYDGEKIVPAEGFRRAHAEAKDIIMVSAEKRKYLEIRDDKSLVIVEGDNETESEHKIDGYCLNPPLLVLSDRKVLRVIQEQSDNEEIFQHLPQLSPIIPKIEHDTPQCIEFVDSRNIFLRDEAIISYYSKMCLFGETNELAWKDIGIEDLQYFDVDERGEFFGVMWVDPDEATQEVVIMDGNLLAGDRYGIMTGDVWPLSFISSWGAIITYNSDDDTFYLGMDSKYWDPIGKFEW